MIDLTPFLAMRLMVVLAAFMLIAAVIAGGIR